MNNLKAKAVMAKNKLGEMPTKVKVAWMCLLATICPAYCDINGNTAMQKFLKTMFSITVFAGIVLIAAGAASLIRTIVLMASGEQAQPRAFMERKLLVLTWDIGHSKRTGEIDYSNCKLKSCILL